MAGTSSGRDNNDYFQPDNVERLPHSAITAGIGNGINIIILAEAKSVRELVSWPNTLLLTTYYGNKENIILLSLILSYVIMVRPITQ